MVRCHCKHHQVDSNCGTGLYLMGKLKGVNEVIAVKGFLDLSDYTRERVFGERQYWLREYCGHVRKEGCPDVY